jgi:hypothetical protein
MMAVEERFDVALVLTEHGSGSHGHHNGTGERSFVGSHHS